MTRKIRQSEPRTFEQMLQLVLKPTPTRMEALALSRPIDRDGQPEPTEEPEAMAYSTFAQRIGMKPDTFHDKITGKSGFWASEARLILAHAPDIELARWFLDGTPWTAAHRLDEVEPEPGLLEDLVTNALVHWCDLTGVVDRAVRDNVIDVDEKQTIYRKVLELETAIASLRKLVEPKKDPDTAPGATPTRD